MSNMKKEEAPEPIRAAEPEPQVVPQDGEPKKEPEKKKAIHIEVTPELHRALKTLAAEQGITIKELVTNTLTERYTEELRQ